MSLMIGYDNRADPNQVVCTYTYKAVMKTGINVSYQTLISAALQILNTQLQLCSQLKPTIDG